MSDEFSKCSLSFKKEIAIIQPEIRYSAKENVRKIIFAVEIPLPLLKEWHKTMIEKASDRERTSGQKFATGSEDEQASSRPSTSQDTQTSKK